MHQEDICQCKYKGFASYTWKSQNLADKAEQEHELWTLHPRRTETDLEVILGFVFFCQC